MNIKNTAYTSAPGKGLMNATAHSRRLEFFKSLVKDADLFTNSTVTLDQVQNNIESFIGTVEVPMGLVGPLLFKPEETESELVYTGLCTTEGSLVASMNRGAKAISECGGFSAHFVHQKMLRAPLFTFSRMNDTIKFERWLTSNFEKIKEYTAQYSNHSELLEIKTYVIGKLAHLKFVYSTCDASGQNIVTNCTWHAILWIAEQFQKEVNVKIEQYYIDGNGSSDKKVSFYSLQHGRGVHVVCECHLNDEIVEKTLRANAKEMADLYNHSAAISRFDGTIGGNINIANAIAGIFAATGQDLGSIHESSIGILQVEKTAKGLYFSLSIPALVIATIGGGTHLPASKAMLEMMNCYGAGKIERFAKLIAGFALSLEISTFAAISSGQFARAHQKLGKNKTVDWLLKSDINTQFFQNNIQKIGEEEIESVEIVSAKSPDNGILTDLASRVSNKVIGFIPLRIITKSGLVKNIMLKSKPLDDDLMKGLHLLASNISVDLADNLLLYKDHIEYKDAHIKEIEVYKFLKNIDYPFMPEFYGEIVDPKREIYLFLLEFLEKESIEILNSENEPELWGDDLILKAIQAIHIVHKESTSELNTIKEFDLSSSIPFYNQCNQINRKDYKHWELDHLFEEMHDIIKLWKSSPPTKKSAKTLIHNDFNTRNVGLRKNGQICIYDWELAVLNIPQRDIFDFLAFSLNQNFEPDTLYSFMNTHQVMLQEINGLSYSLKDYYDDFITCGYEFLITRVSLYLAGSTLVDYSFIQRVFINSHRIIKLAKENYDRV